MVVVVVGFAFPLTLLLVPGLFVIAAILVRNALALHLLTVASLVVVYDTLILVTGVGEGGAVLLGH
jgi:hypothetical protein